MPSDRRLTPMFSHARLSCLAGYYDVPNVSAAMSFDLTYLEHVNSRIVRVDGRIFEVWSPNSSQRPFLAGERRSDFIPSVPTVPAERRYDGHAGRHDCLYVPQYFRADVPHWPYVRRVSEVPLDDPVRPAFAPLIEFWITDRADRRKGHVDPDFLARLTAVVRRLDSKMSAWKTSSLWESRPRYASESRVQRFALCRGWDEAVDVCVALQRGLREQEAWLVYMQTRRDQHRLDLQRLRDSPIPEARERFVGVWVNGLPEMSVLRYLVRGVPCFIVHEYLSSDVPRPVPEGDVYTDFVSGTGLVLILSDDNPYQSIAREQGCLDALSNGDDGRGPHVLELAIHERRSSSTYLEMEARRRASLHYGSRPGSSGTARAPSSAAPPPSRSQSSVPSPAARRAPISAAPQESGGGRAPEPRRKAPTLADASRDRFAAPEIELRVVDPRYSPWIVPPPLPPNWSQKWSKWELAEINREPAWISRSSSSRITATSEWFDRVKGRRLFFGRFRPAVGLLDWDRFGAPVPRHPFFTMDGERAVPQPPSHWMYPTEKIANYNVGKRAAIPRDEGLSRLGELDGDGRAKGKGKAREDDEDDDDEADEDEYGMDIDEVGTHPPSNVVVVGGVDESTSAIMFQGLSASALYRSSARPLSIMRAQGRMWLRFVDTSQGRRAFGALGSVAYGLEVEHRSDAEFRELYEYTRDIWNLEMEDEEALELPSIAKGTASTAQPEDARTSGTASTIEEDARPQHAVSEALSRLSLSPRAQRPTTATEAHASPPPSSISAVVAPAYARPATPVQTNVTPSPATGVAPAHARPTTPAMPATTSSSSVPMSNSSTASDALTRNGLVPRVQTLDRAPPSEPRAMRESRPHYPPPPPVARFSVPPPLEKRLTSPPRREVSRPAAYDAPAPSWHPPAYPLPPPTPSPTTPLLQRILGGSLPLASRLQDPSPHLLSRVDAPPLASRMSDFPQSFFDRIEDAREDEPAQKRLREDSEEEEGLPARFQNRKKKRGSRAGKLAKEQKLEKEARRANAILRELAAAHEQSQATQPVAGPSQPSPQPVAGPSDWQTQAVAEPSNVLVANPDAEESSVEDVDMEEGGFGVTGWGNEDDDDDERPYAATFFK
ncbi:hypothetical protein C8R47DRAFT_1211980 [Mycena vitilis]|nr:hypothetical protein C8R47DRAFT_1211980 [Mycena vitilis]